mmetsp:Transcript_30495/g.98528  ORF Transcript_30495/g.98528 Transcript_30495/m.98528 type:complete len:262 (-) Transcript_30495:1302-2087(-)
MVYSFVRKGATLTGAALVREPAMLDVSPMEAPHLLGTQKAAACAAARRRVSADSCAGEVGSRPSLPTDPSSSFPALLPEPVSPERPALPNDDEEDTELVSCNALEVGCVKSRTLSELRRPQSSEAPCAPPYFTPLAGCVLVEAAADGSRGATSAARGAMLLLASVADGATMSGIGSTASSASAARSASDPFSPEAEPLAPASSDPSDGGEVDRADMTLISRATPCPAEEESCEAKSGDPKLDLARVDMAVAHCSCLGFCRM